MSRTVYSFSIPEESEAAWLLKKYKREGKVISHVIQNAVEYGAKEREDLKRDLKRWERYARRCEAILHGVFRVDTSSFTFWPDEHPQSNQLTPQQPIEALIRCRDGLKKRTEWTINKEAF